MPAAIPAVISMVGMYEALGAATSWGAFLWIVGSTVASYEAANLISSSESSSARDPLNTILTGGEKVNTRSSQTSLKVIYGQRKIGGNDVYIATAGDQGDKDLWIVQVLAEGPCEGIAQDSDGHDLVFFGDKQAYEYPSDKYEYFFHPGDETVCDSHLNAVDPNWTDVLKGTTYIVYHFVYDRDVWMGIPTRTVVLKGRKLYDFRDGTTSYSTNPVLALYDYMTDEEYGLGKSASEIDTTSWTSVANYCDTNGIEINMCLAGLNVYDAIAQMLLPLHGEMYWWDGKYYLRYKDLNSESIALPLTDEHIVQDDTGKAMISISQPGRAGAPDGVKVSFVDKDKDYTSDSVIVGESQGNIKNITLASVTDRQQASLIGLYILERAKLNRKISGTFRGDCVRLDVGDLVSLTTSALGISDQTMRVQEADIRGDNLVDLVLEYEDPALYDQTYDINPEGTYTCSLPDPTSEPPGVANATISEEQYYYRLRTFTRLKISFDLPTDYPWYDHVEVWVSSDNATWKYLYNVETSFNIDPVQEGDTYYIRLKVVNIWGVKQQDDNDYRLSWTVTGKTDRPSSLASLQAIVNSNVINLYSTRVPDPDVEVYEFRLGDTWTSGIFLAALRNPNLSLSGVKPGSFTFWCNSLSNNGSYGDVPVSSTVSLSDPPDGWSVVHTETDDYSGGTHDNTEQTTYASEYYLKCSHADGNLTGTYLSPVYDLGSSGRYLVYLATEYVVTGEGMTWADKFPSPTTWQQGGATTKTWSQIFNITEGSQVHISFKYGDDTSLSNTVERMEILSSIITGRYFQVQIEIDDPGMNVYTLVKHNTLKFCQPA